MAKIRATTTFLDDRDRYEEGVEYDVEPAKAGYFVHNGWAEADGVVRGLGPAPQDVTLDIDSAVIGHDTAVEG